MNLPMTQEAPPETYELDIEIGSNVAAWMRKRNVTGKALAAFLGLDPSGLSERLHGRVPFKAHQIALIARHLEVPVDEFYGRFTFRTETRNLRAVPDIDLVQLELAFPFGEADSDSRVRRLQSVN